MLTITVDNVLKKEALSALDFVDIGLLVNICRSMELKPNQHQEFVFPHLLTDQKYKVVAQMYVDSNGAISISNLKVFTADEKISQEYGIENLKGGFENYDDVLKEIILSLSAAFKIAFNMKRFTLNFSDEKIQTEVNFLQENGTNFQTFHESEKSMIEAVEERCRSFEQELHAQAQAGARTQARDKETKRLEEKLSAMKEKMQEDERNSKEFWENGTGPALIGLGLSVIGLSIWAYRNFKG